MIRARVISILCLLFSLFGISGFAASPAAPFSPPLGKRWFSIAVNGERTGFTTIQTKALTDGTYEISAESSARVVVLSFTREAASRERYVVARDLSLRSFAVDQVVDGTPSRISGELTAKGLRVVTETAGGPKEKILKVKGAVYPPPVLNMYPLLHNPATGKSWKVQMFDPETGKVKVVKTRVIGSETHADGSRSIHLQNNLYSFVDNDVWIDGEGKTLKESVRDGLVETTAEDAAWGKRFVAEGAVAKRDFILEFSRIRINPPLPNPETLQLLVVELDGIPRALPLLQGGGQEAVRIEGARVRFALQRSSAAENRVAGNGDPEGTRHLEATPRIPAADPEIAARAAAIIGETKAPADVVKKLVAWVAGNVAEKAAESGSPVDTLHSRSGTCQSRAWLYTSLARAAGIPTRSVAGVISREKGLLYHSWAESRVGGEWVQVDPTLAQVPADVSHLKLVQGESPEDLLPLAEIVGRVTATVVERR